MGYRAMSPRIEFVLFSSLIASAVATLGYFFSPGDSGPSGETFWFALSAIIPAAVSAALGALYAAASYSRARRLPKRWTPGRLNTHAVLATLAIYPPAVGVAWAILEVASSTHAPALANVSYVLMIGVFVGFWSIIAGAIPTFILEYFACRRYLRRQAVPSMGHA